MRRTFFASTQAGRQLAHSGSRGFYVPGESVSTRTTNTRTTDTTDTNGHRDYKQYGVNPENETKS